MFHNNSCVSPTVGTSPALFSSALNFFAAAQCCLKEDFKSDYVKDGDLFHYIVIGGGTAGAVVASRLSEIPGCNVVLLEAGIEPPMESDIPALKNDLIGSKYDWQYKTINDGKIAQGCSDERIPWPRGKMLGGSGSINALFYVKNYRDYESWEKAGNPSWNIENIKYHYEKAESFQNLKLQQNPYVKHTYGKNGPQVLNRFNNSYRNLYDKVLESYDEMGLKKVIDLNPYFRPPGMSGIATVFAATGQRYSTYQTYLLTVRKRKNLKIVTDAFVTKILINKSRRAYGVQVDINGKRKQLFATLEVIVSAGSINTPQLLMLSGVGSKSHLESKNISCIVDLPGVGKNLQDHIYSIIPIFGDVPFLDDLQSKSEEAFDTIKYLYNRTGTLAQSSNADILVFYSQDKNASYPEFQSHLLVVNKNNTSRVSSFTRSYKESIRRSFIEPIKSSCLYAFIFQLLHPLSHGDISLNTSSPYDHPLINANYFDDPLDLKSTGIGMSMLSKIVNTTFFKSINAFLQRVDWPECNKYALGSKKYWECQSKNTALSIYHPVGTSKMGPNPKDCVVDDKLKVHGVFDLRVVDASIMPNITSGNTYAPTVMIGEMGATMIKSDHLPH